MICTEDEDLTVRLRELTAGKGVERAIDCVAGELGAEVACNLSPAGTMLCMEPFPVIGRRIPQIQKLATKADPYVYTLCGRIPWNRLAPATVM